MSDKLDFSLTSYIFGVASIVLAFISPIAGLVFGIIGLIQSTRQKTKVSKVSKKLNIIGIIIACVLFAANIILFFKSGGLSNFPVA
jgi:ABC-type spermidine/putrescine transport system permease subunit II